jgi:hypothetical protein
MSTVQKFSLFKRGLLRERERLGQKSTGLPIPDQDAVRHNSSRCSSPFTAMVAVILPGSTVTVTDQASIYFGYKGIVQRLSGIRAAVLFEGGCWDKLVTIPRQSLTLS